MLPILFLKAAVRTQINVPGYTRKDGTYVKPHQKIVLVDAAFSQDEVLAGRGSYYQRLAHRNLHRHLDGFHALPADHQHAILLAHATDLQQAASSSAALSGWKKCALAGQNPKRAMWSAFRKLPADRQAALMEAVRARMGSVDHLVDTSDPSALNASTSGAEVPRVANLTAEQQSALAMIPWGRARLAESNTNARTHNRVVDRIEQLARAGDLEGLQAIADRKASGRQTYVRAQHRLALAAISALQATGGEPAAPAPEAAPDSAAPVQAEQAVDPKLAGPAPLMASSVAQAGPALSVRELPSEQRQAFFELRNQRNAAQFYQLPKEEKAQARQQAKLDGIRAQIRELESSIAFNRTNGMQDEVARLTAMHGTLSSSAAREHRALLKKQDAVEQRRRLIQHLNGKLAQLVAGTDDPYFDPASGRSITDEAARAEYARAQAQAGRAYLDELSARSGRVRSTRPT